MDRIAVLYGYAAPVLKSEMLYAFLSQGFKLADVIRSSARLAESIGRVTD